MKKLNNKGMTAIEILITFVLVALITVSLYGTISSYNNKQNIESFKEKIYTYKNTLTKLIQDDLIKKGLISATYSVKESTRNSTEKGHIYTVNMNLRDGSTKSLIITRFLASELNAKPEDYNKTNDYFMIEYDGTEYPIPDVGEYENDEKYTVKDIRINNVEISTSNNVLSIYIGFYHPDLSTRYSIDIVCPINYF